VTRGLGDLDALLAGIRRQTQQHALVCTTEAQQLASAVVAEAETQATELLEAAAAEAEHEADALEQRLLAQAELEAMRLWLLAREELLERVFVQAEAELAALVTGPDYGAVLERLAALAAAALSGPVIILRADPHGHELLTPERLAAWGRGGVRFERTEPRPDGGGGLVAEHGRERFDASFASRLTEGRSGLREAVFARLTGAAP
jgi:vacuolar-type H+-ATPase subunit E/Vma4